MKRTAICLCVLACTGCDDQPLPGQVTGPGDDAPVPVQTRCAELANVALDEGKIVEATWVPESPFTAFSDDPNGPTKPVPAHCKVVARMTPTAESDITVETWLPGEHWNGRFHGVGNGGFAGNLNVHDLAIAVQRGYAAATTDTGHGLVGTEQWAIGNPEKVEDYGHRGIHLAAVVGKTLVAELYGTAPEYSYFSACSNGGRQAMLEAIRYPGDYDGIIAGAPAADFNGLLVASMGRNAEVLRETAIDKSIEGQLAEAVIAQCDKDDGVNDGVIANPLACDFDASALACDAAGGAPCLTTDQTAALKAIRAPRLDANGRWLGAGFPPGGEAAIPPSPGWGDWIFGSDKSPSVQWHFFSQYMRDFVTEDPDWSMEDFDLERDIRLAKAKLGAIVDATDPDLSAFAERGGKPINWHGCSDAAIPATASIHLYEEMVDEMGQPAVDDFAQLYLAPGVHHCWFGPGPWSFNPFAAVRPLEPRRDMAAALETWVESGVAPTELVAMSPVVPLAPIRGEYPVAAKREGLLCPYPSIARYHGSGDADLAESYECVEPE
jgi:feruloyl esterase